MKRAIKRIIISTAVLSLVLLPVSYAGGSELDETVPPSIEKVRIDGKVEIPAYDDLDIEESEDDSGENLENDIDDTEGSSEEETQNESSNSGDNESSNNGESSSKEDVDASDNASKKTSSRFESRKKENKKIKIEDIVKNTMGNSTQELEDTAVSATAQAKEALEKEITEESKKQVEDITRVVDEVLDREDIEIDKATDLTRKLIKNNISKVVLDKNTTRKDKDVYKRMATKLAKKALKKSGKVQLSKNFIDEKMLAKAIISVKKASGDLKETLKDSAIKNVNDVMKENITLATESEAIEVSEEILSTLNENKVGLSVEASNGTELSLERDSIKNLKEKKIEVKSKQISDKANKFISEKAGSKYKVIKTKDIEVNIIDKEGNREALTEVKVSLDISDYEGNQDVLSVIIFDEETQRYEQVKSWVEEDKLVLRTPHYSYYTIAEYNNSFEDIKNHWGEDVIIKMASKGIVNGRSEEQFMPNDQITRAEFVKILVESFDMDSTTPVTFKDVHQDEWFYSYINSAIKEGLLDGMSHIKNGKFLPNQSITREDIIVLMANVFENETGEKLVSQSSIFNDIDEASENAIESINAAYEYGFINGYDGKMFKPKGFSTRAEAMEILNNFLVHLK